MIENLRRFIAEAFNSIDERSGLSRIHNMMNAKVNSVHTVGILTAENPMNKPLSPEENNKRMESLYSDLKGLGLGYIKIKGMYNRPEKSIIIPNVSLNIAKALSSKYEQESFIFGKKNISGDKSLMKFELRDINDNVIDTKSITLSNDSVDSYDDFYSSIKSRKFVIPFFNKKFDNKITNNSGNIVNNDSKNNRSFNFANNKEQ
jgi:hypothetical protein